jgi:hypothetical protein
VTAVEVDVQRDDLWGRRAVADHDRLLAELAARDGDLSQAEEAVQTASAKLAFLIHADPSGHRQTALWSDPVGRLLPQIGHQRVVSRQACFGPEMGHSFSTENYGETTKLRCIHARIVSVCNALRNHWFGVK